MKALVTGANGLIGANVVRALLAGGYQALGPVHDPAKTPYGYTACQPGKRHRQ